ncbi:bifunctional diaminohydroxyphosphoribosylaminopyrimidine deaminase/5-amino-6-(5-phosphoribosylamino)uracil reductase RibD [Ensifer soli]|uniref:bifunctional diaminohydroxyphosphoribosylaminopyrimidine deaminase/5-amino-6-(5-phosphoribosylamino)uracil reductase RibD n=1 Tax=Ciceribacter sp. sgz301302 TaxID=3342379 RepID=UPI0035BAAF50
MAGADERFMAAALRLSRRHLGLTDTNPSVACLIVREDVVVGTAVTAIGGRPHAETQALAEAGARARGATAYVTLEPCAHHGRTPPCCDALIAAGIVRVVVCVTDPDERVFGEGIARMHAAGIEVMTDLLRPEGEKALSAYLSRKRRHRPEVTLKLAVSADGMIGRKGVGQVPITGAIARAQTHRMRAESDAILVGLGTALADDPELTCRLPGLEQRSPLRIVLDRRLDLPLASRLVATAGTVPLIVVAEAPAPDAESAASPAVPEVHAGSALRADPRHDADGFARRRAALEREGAAILLTERHHLHDLLGRLSARGLSSLMVEGGAAIARAFLEADLVDRIALFTGPRSIGEGGIASPCVDGRIDGFAPVGRAVFGPDRYTEYERES